MGRFERIFLEKLEDVFGSPGGFEYRGTVVIRTPITIFTPRKLLFYRILNNSKIIEEERKKIPLKPDINNDLCSRKGYMSSIGDYLKSEGLFIAECNTCEGGYLNPFFQFCLSGELYLKKST